MIKRIITAVLVVLLVLGCQTSIAPSDNLPQNFNDYLDSLLINSIRNDDIGINLSFIDPVSFGIEPILYELGFNDGSDYDDAQEEVKQILADLKSYKNLENQELLDQEALISYFEMYQSRFDFYDFIEGSTLGYSRALSANIPSYLEVYTFHTLEDFDRYFHFIETLPTHYQSYLNLELERQERKTGYSDFELKKMIQVYDQLRESILDDDYFLFASFDEQVDAMALSLNEKDTLKAKNRKVLQTSMYEAYTLLVEGLDIEANEPVGLVHKPNGKAYYEYLYATNTGSKRSVEKSRDLLLKRLRSIQGALKALLPNQEAYDAYFKYEQKTFPTAQTLMNHLEKSIENDFPAIDAINYEIRKVDPSLESASSPAFYFTPQVDYTTKHKQYIYVNGEYVSENFSYYAHEGMPGHMYQFNYFLNLPMHAIRNLLTSTANAEGWANYVEHYALKYVSDEMYARVSYLLADFNQIVNVLMDIGVNYDGWSFEEFVSYLKDIGFIDDTVSKTSLWEGYVYFIHNPCVYPTYYVSSVYIDNLKEAMQSEWGDAYSDYRFHEAFLSYGSINFDFIESKMKP